MLEINENVKKNIKVNVFIIGLRGYTQNYGGWEALAHGMLDNWKDSSIHFYAFEKVTTPEDEGIAVVKGVTCIRLYVKNSGNSTMMWYDAKATVYALKYIKENDICNPILYHLGVRIGPMVFAYRSKFKKAGIVLMVNPAGLEWKRTKWNKLVQIYLAIAAYLMAKSTDYLICDSKGIRAFYEKLIKSKNPVKEYISYGSYPSVALQEQMPDRVSDYFNQWDIKPNDYFLILGRFTPENNYEMMIKGFMEADVTKKLIIVCNYKTEIQRFHDHILKETNYSSDRRIKMVGTMYDCEILNYLRQNAVGYIHGHSVGGTNPGLLEAMSATNVNLLYDVVFNKEVGGDVAVYFKDSATLAKLVDQVSSMSSIERKALGLKAKKRMKDLYSWEFVVDEYQKVFHKPFAGSQYYDY